MSWGWSIATLVVIVAITVVVDWLKKPRSTGTARARGQANRAPHPAARIVEMPGGVIRLIDLRSLPDDDLVHLRLGVVQQQLSLERTVPVQIWVVDSTTARGWSQLDPIGRLIGLQRLRDPRNVRGQNFIYTTGSKLREHELAALKEANVEVVEGLHTIGDTAESIDEFLEPVTPWHPSDDDRPVADATVIKTGPFDGELVHVIERHAFIDLRRAVPGAITNGVAFDRIEKAIAALRTMNVKRVTWIAAPWVLELLDAEKTGRIDRLASSMFASIDQRLAVYAANGEPVMRHPLMQRFSPLGDRTVLDRLHDTYFAAAWKQPRL